MWHGVIQDQKTSHESTDIFLGNNKNRKSILTHCDARSICACLDAAYADAVSGRFVATFFFGLGFAFVVPADDFVTVLDVLLAVPPPPPLFELAEGADAVPIFSSSSSSSSS